MGAKRRRKEATEPPDLNLVLESFSKCRRKDGTLSTDHYLCACNELITWVNGYQLPKCANLTRLPWPFRKMTSYQGKNPEAEIAVKF